MRVACVRSTLHIMSDTSSVATLPAHQIARQIESEYLTPPEVAQMLRVSEATVYRWALSDATMPVTRAGRTVRFRRTALERWLAQREQGRGRAR